MSNPAYRVILHSALGKGTPDAHYWRQVIVCHKALGPAGCIDVRAQSRDSTTVWQAQSFGTTSAPQLVSVAARVRSDLLALGYRFNTTIQQDFDTFSEVVSWLRPIKIFGAAGTKALRAAGAGFIEIDRDAEAFARGAVARRDAVDNFLASL